MFRALSSLGFSFAHSCFLDSERLYQFWSILLAIRDLVFFSRTRYIYPLGCSSFKRVNFVKPHHEADKFLFDSTSQWSYVRICMNWPCCINVFQWNRECSFLRHVELNSRFIVMTTDEVTLNRPQVGLQRHLLVLSGETLPIHFWSSPLRSSLGMRSISLTILLYHLQLGITIYHLFCFINTSLSRVDSSRINFWCVRRFPNSSRDQFKPKKDTR